MSTTLSLIEAIHGSPARLSLSICGAGSLAVGQLTKVAGCSHTLVHAETLYALPATGAALDYTPSPCVAAVVARQLAQHAYTSGLRLDQSSPSTSTVPPLFFGVGATSAVKTNRGRHNGDQAYVCVWGGDPTKSVWASTYRLELADHYSRREQDDQVSELILRATASAVGDAENQLTTPGEAESTDHFSVPLTLSIADGVTAQLESRLPVPAPEAVVSRLTQAVVDGEVEAVLWNRHGEVRVRSSASDARPPHGLSHLYGGDEVLAVAHAEPGRFPLSRSGALQLLYPGSFRPLHWGHTELVRAASAVVQRLYQQRCAVNARPPPPVVVTYELAAAVVDKGAASVDSLAQRVHQFLERGERVAVTPARLFVEKARLFPGHGFIVGIDTAVRILDPQYYEGGDEAGMVRALLRDIDAHGCYFVVGGRLASPSAQLSEEAKQTATWLDMSTLAVPEPLQHMFISVPEKAFRVDVSSTELRSRMGMK